MPAVNGNEYAWPDLYASDAVRTGIARNGDEYAWPVLYASDAIRTGMARNGEMYPPPTGGPPPVTVTYGLAAVDTGSGRQYWQSPVVSFAFAPVPVGAWDVASLTIQYEV